MEPIEYTARLDSGVLALPVNTEMPSSSPVCELVFMPEKTARPWWFVAVQSGKTANVERQKRHDKRPRGMGYGVIRG